MSSSTGPKRSIGISKVALVTAFVFILGGGTAFGAFVVSSNSQIGPNTVSGHKPPAGKHANIIGGSVNGTDLASGAVTNAKLGPGSVTSGKLAAGAVTNSRLGSQSVTNAKIGNQAIDDRTIKVGAVTNGDLAQGAVSSEKIGLIPQARAEFSGDQTITNSTNTALIWDLAAYDSDGLFSISTPNRLTAPVAGVYAITAGVRWDTSSTGGRFVSICKNNAACGELGSSALAASWQPAEVRTAQSVSTQAKLAAGDFITVNVFQDSGGDLKVLSNSSATNLAMSWIGNG